MSDNAIPNSSLAAVHADPPSITSDGSIPDGASIVLPDAVSDDISDARQEARRKFASIFLDLEAESEFDESEDDEEMGNEDEDFINDELETRESSGEEPIRQVSRPPAVEFEDVEAIAAQYRDRAKHARTGPSPYDDNEENVVERMLKPIKLMDEGVDESKYELYVLKCSYPRCEARIVADWLPSACVVMYSSMLEGRVYLWVPSAQVIVDAYKARSRILNMNRLSFVPVEETRMVFDYFRRQKDAKTRYRIGNWIRIRKGKYRGDFGVVKDVQLGNFLLVAVLPRVAPYPKHQASPAVAIPAPSTGDSGQTNPSVAADSAPRETAPQPSDSTIEQEDTNHALRASNSERDDRAAWSTGPNRETGETCASAASDAEAGQSAVALAGSGLRVLLTSVNPHAGQCTRPAQCLATVDWLKASFPNERVTEFRDGTYEFRGGRYRDGLRILRLSGLWHVDLAYSSLEDVFPFNYTDLGDLQDVEYYIQRGDVIVVQYRDLKGLVGAVVDVDHTTVAIGQLRRLDFPPDTNLDSLATSVRCIDVLRIIEVPSEEDSLGLATVPKKAVRRILDVGDEVIIRVGPCSGKSGLVVDVEAHMITLQVSVSDSFTKLPRSWVETIDSGGSFVTLSNWDEIIRDGSLVMIRSGHFKGRIWRVDNVEGEIVKFRLPGPKENVDLTVTMRMNQVIKISPKAFETGQLPNPDSEGLGFTKSGRSPYIGMFVLIRNADGKNCTDLNTKIAKGTYGHITSVDPDRKTARVTYLSTEAEFPLRSLVSYDYLFCLDGSRQLSEKEATRYAQRFQAYAEATKPKQQSRAPEGSAMQQPLPGENEFGRPCTSVAVTDFSGPGKWIFHPTIRALYRTHKVYVHIHSKDRAAFLSGDIEEEHERCWDAHLECRVRVHIDWSRTISDSVVDVCDIRPCLPTKKGELVLEVGLSGHQEPRIFQVKGLPRHYSGVRPLKLGEPGDTKRTWEMPASRFTKLEINK